MIQLQENNHAEGGTERTEVRVSPILCVIARGPKRVYF